MCLLFNGQVRHSFVGLLPLLGNNLGRETKMMNINTIPRLTQIIILSGIIISQSLFAQGPTETNADSIAQHWLNINYAGDELTGHLLDIFLPSKGEAPFPVVITVAGSAFFSNNSKQHAFSIGKILLKYGFAIVATNHRSSREAIFPAHVNDLKGVVRFLRANASKYRLDTTFIGIAGNSSGGNLAAMMGTSSGVKNYTVGEKTVSIEGDIGGNTTESSRVDAVVDWYGPTAFERMDSCGSKMVHDAPDSPESVYIGESIQNNLDLCALANPITYVDKNDPPFLVIHGEADPLVPHCQSVLLYKALKKNGVACEMITVPGAGHGGIWEEKYKEKMASFFIEAKNKKRGHKQFSEYFGGNRTAVSLDVIAITKKRRNRYENMPFDSF
jgi:acetyl esterase/lipase